MSTEEGDFIKMIFHSDTFGFKKELMTTIDSFDLVQWFFRWLQAEITMIYLFFFDGLGIMECWFKRYTIAPNMICFIPKFASSLSHGCAIIILLINAFQRVHIFLDLSCTQQHSVQNGIIFTQFKINLQSSLGILEYLFIWSTIHMDWYFRRYLMWLMSLTCMPKTSVDIRKKFVHTRRLAL